MLNRIVPTELNTVPLASVLALKAKTSLSGRSKADRPFRLVPGVEPVPADLHDHAHLGGRVAVRVVVRAGHPTAAEAVGLVNEGLVDDRGLVARVEGRDVDGGPVGRERARRVREEGQHVDRRAADRAAEAGGVEHPDVGAIDALAVVKRGSAGIAAAKDARDGRVGAVLAAVGRGDEGPVAARAGEDDVARLVAHQQGARDERHGAREVDDADAVRQVVHDPDFVVGPGRDRDRLHADRHRGREGQPAGAHVEDLECIVRAC